MFSRIARIPSALIICCIASVLIFLQAPAECDAMSVSPSRIILNAECVGSSQDIQATFGVTIQSGSIVDLNANFYFMITDPDTGDDVAVWVCWTDSFHYCWIDDNLMLSFERDTIQEEAVTYGLVNTDCEVFVECSFSILSSDGSKEDKYLSGTDVVEILAPGKKY